MTALPEISLPALGNLLDSGSEFVFLDCARSGSEENRSFLFTGPDRWLVCTAAEDAQAFLDRADALRGQGGYLAGWFSYEFGYLLEPSLRPLCPRVEIPYAVLGVFDSPTAISSPVAAQPFSLTGADETDTCQVENIRTNISKDDYLQAVERIKEYIVAGDTYQVNFTLKLLFEAVGSHAMLYESLRRNQAVSYGAWIRQGGRDIMSFSPELFFRADRKRITVRPMKGTMKRGKTLGEDERLRQALHEDLKNRSENVMIVDLLRNDLGRLLQGSGGGRVLPRTLFDVEVYDTVLQMTSTIDGFPAKHTQLSLRQIMDAIFPCGSVTGAPKIRTMEIIRELEKEPRGIYCGAIGFAGPEESVFNVPIRTVVLEGSSGEMGIGSGIVFDSGPEAEWQESLLKARFLSNPQPEFQLIETLLWQPESGYWLLAEHLQRLADSAAYFLFQVDMEEVRDRLDQEAEGLDSPARVRLLLDRLGRLDITATPLVHFSSPRTGPPWPDAPLRQVHFSGIPTDPENVHYYHKTTRRDLYRQEREKALEKGFYEVLFVNSGGEVTEGSITNIFVLRGGRLLTPPVESGLLPGTFRRFLLDSGCASEQVLTREDLRGAEAVFIGNSVRGLERVVIAGD